MSAPRKEGKKTHSTPRRRRSHSTPRRRRSHSPPRRRRSHSPPRGGGGGGAGGAGQYGEEGYNRYTLGEIDNKSRPELGDLPQSGSILFYYIYLKKPLCSQRYNVLYDLLALRGDRSLRGDRPTAAKPDSKKNPNFK